MEWVEATEEDYKELMKFVHDSAVNSLRLLLNSEGNIVSRRWLRMNHIGSWIENELDDMGMIVDNDESSVCILKDNISSFLKSQSATCKEQARLEG